MSYHTSLGNIAERYDEITGNKISYRLDVFSHSGSYDEYVIVRDINGTEEEVISFIENEAYRLADIINSER